MNDFLRKYKFPLVVKLNIDLLNYKKGQKLTLTKDNSGIKITSYWLKRLKDSKIDNCLTICDSVVRSIKNENPKNIKSK
ncbi:MAG: hypothetical protein PVJ67_03700 [Candidatus Pacearchaeota archaeon]|jgi:hypothetical protein